MKRDTSSNYRQIRVLIDPGRGLWHVAVMARSVRYGTSTDVLVWRGTVPVTSALSTKADIVRAASRAMARAAEGL